MDIAPLNIVAHPSLAAALAPFADEVPHTHQARLLYATQASSRLAPRERLARAVASIQAQLPAQPWKVCMSQPMFPAPFGVRSRRGVRRGAGGGEPGRGVRRGRRRRADGGGDGGR
jgi:hypothetical protein